MSDAHADLHRELAAIKKTTDAATDADAARAGLVGQGLVLMDMLDDGSPTWPEFNDVDIDEVYAWFFRNNVSEWLPENFETTVTGGQITYTAWVWQVDPDGNSLRGWDKAHMNLRTESRTVPLRFPLDDVVRASFAAKGLRLTEDTPTG